MRPPLCLSSLFIYCALLCTDVTAQQQSLPHLVQRATSAVVIVATNDGYGTGFFIAPDLVATNQHVIGGAGSVLIKAVRNSQTYRAEVIAVDDENDLAILRVQREGRSTSVLRLAKGLPPDIGEAIFVVGNPRGYLGTLSTGIVSGYRAIEGGARMQISADVSPGSSGSPVLNMRGEVVGIAELSLTNSQHLNFAILAGSLQDLLVIANAPKKPAVDYDAIAAAIPDSSTKEIVVGAGNSARYAISSDGSIHYLAEPAIWTDTGIMVLKGQRVTITSKGSAFFGSMGLLAGPGGNRNIPATGKIAPPWATAALVATIGSGGKDFLIGTAGTFVAPVTGVLFLGINDGTARISRGAYISQIVVRHN